MCVYSMVYDHFRPKLPDPDFWPSPPMVPGQSPAEVEKILETFKKASEAAKVVDELTGQKDCQDPEKAKLELRVAELERKIAELHELQRKPRRKAKKRRK